MIVHVPTSSYSRTWSHLPSNLSNSFTLPLSQPVSLETSCESKSCIHISNRITADPSRLRRKAVPFPRRNPIYSEFEGTHRIRYSHLILIRRAACFASDKTRDREERGAVSNLAIVWGSSYPIIGRENANRLPATESLNPPEICRGTARLATNIPDRPRAVPPPRHP